MADDLTERPAKVERRSFARRTVIESRLVSVDLGPSARGVLIDVGEGGVAVQPFVALPVGSESDVMFETPSGARVKAHGLVAWVGENGRTGIRFTDVQPDAVVELRRWTESSDESPEVIEQIYRRDAVTQSERRASLQQVVAHTRSATNSDGAAIALRDSSGIRCMATVGDAPDLGVLVIPGKGVAGECVEGAKPVLCCDARADARVDRAAALALNMLSCAMFPITAGEEIVGVIGVFSSKPDAFDENTLHFLQEAGSKCLVCDI